MSDLTDRLLDHAAQVSGLDPDVLHANAQHPIVAECLESIGECYAILDRIAGLADSGAETDAAA